MEPIRALAWIEGVAIALAALADAGIILLDPAAAAINQHVYPLTLATAAVCAFAIFSIPHSPNRRYLSVAVAFATLLAVGWLPPDGLLLFVLAACLAARLTFAFGVPGALATWAVTLAALTARFFSASYGPDAAGGSNPHGILAYVAIVVPYAILLGLIFGIIGLMKVYSSRSADSAAMRERTRIALDLHDFLGHSLTTLRVQLQNAERYRASDPAKADDYVRRAGAGAGQLLDDVRDTVGRLRDPGDDASVSFATLFERTCDEFAANHDVMLERSIDVRRELPGRTAFTLHRSLLEALTNVARHSAATHVWIDVRTDGANVVATIEDNGRGMPLAPSVGHGIASMRERAHELGGTLTIEARTGGGTVVRTRVPLEAAR